MAKLSKEHKVKYGEDAVIIMREPTNKEWNTLNSGRVKLGRKGRPDTSGGLKARCQLFDAVLTSIENLEDDDGKITMETIERIPARLKEQWIMETFENDEGEHLEDTEKNF